LERREKLEKKLSVRRRRNGDEARALMVEFEQTEKLVKVYSESKHRNTGNL
jgi:hypothetical protein